MDDREILLMQRRGFEFVEALRVERLRTMSHPDWLKSLRFVYSMSEPNDDLFRAALTVQRDLHAQGFEFCFIGGLALQRWGEVRHTDDIDLTIRCDLGDELKALEKLLKILRPRTDRLEEVARVGRMFVGYSKGGTNVDISLGCIDYERRLMARAVDVDFGIDEALHCCSAEDLAILKTVAGRGQDWVDIVRICHRSGAAMDWDLVFEELEPLLASIHKPESLDRLRDIVDREVRPGSGSVDFEQSPEK